MTENFNSLSKNFNSMSENSNSFSEKFNQELKGLREDQGVMLKELIYLSKRVAVVEEKH
jgi:uncharacterized protein YeaO (DUF488 family)